MILKNALKRLDLYHAEFLRANLKKTHKISIVGVAVLLTL